MKTSEEIKDWNSWIESNYSGLVTSAQSIHRDAHDLVHHTYVRILRLKGVKLKKVMEQPHAYFRRAMFIEATRGKFKKQYKYADQEVGDIKASDYDLSHAFMLENFQLATDRLSWFDRAVLQLYCDGYNLTQISRESGINSNTFHVSLHRTREKLKLHFSPLHGSLS